MENENKKQTQKIDWKNKGLGWIPDYPDLRDYTLTHEDIQKDGRLKIKGDTDKIENFSETVIEIFKILREIRAEKKTSELEKRINEIETQFFGDISFINVKLYRSLRRQVETRLISDNSRDERKKSELSKQIIALKNYLSIMVLQGYLRLQKPQELATPIYPSILQDSAKKSSWELFEDLTQIFHWLQEENFDEITELLVMLFQHASGITVDGIVGLETYTALNESFSDHTQLDNLKDWFDPTNEEERLILPIPNLPETRLVYVYSLMHKTIFNMILNELKSKIVEQASKDYSSFKPENKERLFEFFEVNFLKDIGLKKSKKFMTLLSRDQPNETRAEKILNDLLKQEQFSNIEVFNKIYEDELFLIEPIVSFVVKKMSPLAQRRNSPLLNVVTEALKETEKIFHKAFSENPQTNDSTIITLNESNELYWYRIAKKALIKVIQELVIRIKLIIPDNGNSKLPELSVQEINSKLYFYFLVKKFLSLFIKPEEFYKYIKEPQPTIFDKQELFELELLPCSTTDSSSTEADVQNKTSGKGKLELFVTHKLQIPVSNCLIESLKLRNLQADPNLKPYLFLPSVVDLSYWASTVEDQGALKSCTAFAGIALIEYFTNRSRGQFTDLSPLFLYKAVRNLMSLTGDVGASVRETMKAMALFGVPPEEYWPYEEGKVNEEPPSFCYSYAQNFQALKYFRLDYPDMPTELLLSQVKAVLAAGFPCVFGFTVYTSAYENSNIKTGYIPFPSKEKDRVVSGHAVVAMGYDDLQSIPYSYGKGDSQGAFLIRNSWGTEWGKEGYGWIPYEYVLQGLTRDWWSLLKSEWFDQDSDGPGARSTGDDGPPPPTDKTDDVSVKH